MSANQDVYVANQKEVDDAIGGVLDRSGYQLNQLRTQAKSGYFDSEKARRAWIVVAGLGAK